MASGTIPEIIRIVPCRARCRDTTAAASGPENGGLQTGGTGPSVLPAVPELLMEIEGDRVQRRLDQCHGTAQQQTSGHRVDDAESDGKMHYCKGKGLGHGAPDQLLLRIIPEWGHSRVRR